MHTHKYLETHALLYFLTGVAAAIGLYIYSFIVGMNRYLGDEVKTKDRLIKNPWAPYQNDPTLGGPSYRHSENVYRTGDRGRIRADGQVEILGRSDFTVKIRAFKVALSMVKLFSLKFLPHHLITCSCMYVCVCISPPRLFPKYDPNVQH